MLSQDVIDACQKLYLDDFKLDEVNEQILELEANLEGYRGFKIYDTVQYCIALLKGERRKYIINKLLAKK